MRNLTGNPPCCFASVTCFRFLVFFLFAGRGRGAAPRNPYLPHRAFLKPLDGTARANATVRVPAGMTFQSHSFALALLAQHFLLSGHVIGIYAFKGSVFRHESNTMEHLAESHGETLLRSANLCGHGPSR